jgi:acyl dehydratase
MPVNTDAIGREYPPVTYTVGREKIREYANAIGADNPVHHDREAALAAGFRDLVAPPMFCVVYSGPAIAPGVLDPEVGMNLAMMVHAGQEFIWGEPVCAGDEITTSAKVTEIYERDGKGFYVFESVSTNQDGDEVVRGTWTDLVRGV